MALDGRRPGLAYGAFKCSDTREPVALLKRMRQALQNMKDASEETKIPKEIEFSVFNLPEGMHKITLDEGPELVVVIEPLIEKGANYVVKAELPGAENHVTAHELAYAFSCLYGGTELFDAENDGQAKLVMDVYFKQENGVWVSKLAMDK